MNKRIEIKNLNKNFGNIEVLKDINLDIYDGEFIAIVGHSGCGKSTLLNLISNVDNNYEGILKVNGTIGYMLQSDALLPWLSNLDNTLLPTKFNYKVDKNYILKLFNKYNLSDFINSKPSNLSGGMKQRISLIRCLSTHPNILLLDEPFSALDYQTRLLIEKDIYNIIKQEKKTVIIVTHDISEAVSMADKIIILTKRPGKIKNIYDIKLNKKGDPITNRSDEKFNYYFNLIWDDLQNE